MKYYRSHVLVSINDTSINAGVKDFIQALRAELAKTGLQEELIYGWTEQIFYFL